MCLLSSHDNYDKPNWINKGSLDLLLSGSVTGGFLWSYFILMAPACTSRWIGLRLVSPFQTISFLWKLQRQPGGADCFCKSYLDGWKFLVGAVLLEKSIDPSTISTCFQRLMDPAPWGMKIRGPKAAVAPPVVFNIVIEYCIIIIIYCHWMQRC